MKAFLFVLAGVAGLLNAVQAGCNAALGKAIGPFAAGIAVLLVSMTVFVATGLVSGRLEWPGMARISDAPWWAWCGGALGALFIMAQLFAASELGSAVFMALTVTAAVSMSLVLDHYGLVGFKQHTAGWGRIAGAALMIAGLGLIARY